MKEINFMAGEQIKNDGRGWEEVSQGKRGTHDRVPLTELIFSLLTKLA